MKIQIHNKIIVFEETEKDQMCSKNFAFDD